MSDIDSRQQSDRTQDKDYHHYIINNNCDDYENPDSATTTTDCLEPNYDALLKPNKEFVRSDKSISSTASRDLNYCFDVILKEAVKENKLVKQVCYTMLSAYSNNPINLAINSDSGEGKTHVLMKVSDLFPDTDVQYIADMSEKAIFHQKGYLGIKNEDGDFENVEGHLYDLKETLDSKMNEFKKLGNGHLTTKDDLKKEIAEIQKQINSIQVKAVKVIDLNHKILIFLDTPKEGIFKAFMSLLSHDKIAVEYHYVDTSSRTGITTKINVLLGWPAVIFAQAIDYTNHPRYQEIQRRFIVTNPRMDEEKYQSAVDYSIVKNSLPDLAFQLKIVSDDEKKLAREILLNIRDDLLSLSSTIKPGKNNILIPYHHLISQLLSKNRTAQDMTFVNRLLNLVGLLTNVNIKKRPFLEIQSIFGSDSFRIPMALYSDLIESLSFINNSTGGIRPYVLDWYQNVFLSLYSQKSEPNFKDRNGQILTEDRVAVTTQELIEKTKEVRKKRYTSKNLLTEFLYPLLNLGYIDSIPSLIDKRAYIYFPVLDVTNEKSINLFLSDKKNNLFQDSHDNDENLISNSIKTQIISNIREIEKYYSENKYLVTLRIADEDNIYSIEEEDGNKEAEEISEKYYSKSSLENNDKKCMDMTFKDYDISIRASTCEEEYLQQAKFTNELQDIQTNDIRNSKNDPKISNNVFSDKEKNKIIYSCYHGCNFQTHSKQEYQKHYVINHPGKPAYPTIADILKNGLTPQGKPWE